MKASKKALKAAVILTLTVFVAGSAAAEPQLSAPQRQPGEPEVSRPSQRRQGMQNWPTGARPGTAPFRRGAGYHRPYNDGYSYASAPYTTADIGTGTGTGTKTIPAR